MPITIMGGKNMIINQSQVAMSSQRSFIRRQTDTFSVSKQQVEPEKKGFKDFIEQLGGNGQQEEISNNYAPGSIEGAKFDYDGLSEDDLTLIRFQTMNFLFRLLFYKQMGGSTESLAELEAKYSMNTPKQYMINMNHTSSYYESETTSFSTQGKVVTADGREIDFGIDVTMSRSFASEYSESVSQGLRYIDPLVINIDSNPTSIEDMKFEFDLDSDGKKEEISMLGSTSAFLALDKNGNGEIDDGSELFGTSSGDGFKDLSAYDLDKNGWIDEADEVFDKLRLWQVNADGTKTLYTLKDKDIGALYLGNVDTTFSVNNDNNETNALIRKTGLFLREDGSAGTMAHVDLVS